MLDGPLVVLFEQEGADEAEDGVNESRQPSLSDELFIELDARREGVSSPANVGWGTETLLQAVSARPGVTLVLVRSVRSARCLQNLPPSVSHVRTVSLSAPLLCATLLIVVNNRDGVILPL